MSRSADTAPWWDRLPVVDDDQKDCAEALDGLDRHRYELTPMTPEQIHNAKPAVRTMLLQDASDTTRQHVQQLEASTENPDSELIAHITRLRQGGDSQ